MVKFLYFDSNVYDHIYKGINLPEIYQGINFSEKHYSILKAAVNSGKISILLSSINIEETVALLNSDPKMGIEQLKLIFSLINPFRIIKPHNDIINDDICSFAKRGLSSSSFILNQDYIWRFEFLLNLNQESINELINEVYEPSQKVKEDFMEFQEEIKHKLIPKIKEIKRQKPNFLNLYDIIAEDFLKELIESTGQLENCKRRGLNKILEVKSIKLCIGFSLSLLFAQLFEERSPDLGDSRDLYHTIAASAADIFVSEDRKLVRTLSRIGINNFEVIDLQELIKRII